MRSDHRRILDALEAIECIERYARKGREVFERDELVQVWIVHHMQVLGESLSRLSEDVRGSAPEVPWNKIRGMRNLLVHHYFGIDLDVVWTAVEKDLPSLRSALEQMKEERKG